MHKLITTSPVRHRFSKFWFESVKAQKTLILTVALWSVVGIWLQAQAQNTATSSSVVNSGSVVHFETKENVTNITSEKTNDFNKSEEAVIPSSLLGVNKAEALNASQLRVTQETQQTDEAEVVEVSEPSFAIEGIKLDYRNDSESGDKRNQIVEPSFQFRLPNDQKLRFKTGFNTFEEPGIDTVTNIPAQLGWSGKIGEYKVEAAGGLDFFNRLPTALNFNTKVDAPPIYMNLTPDYKLVSGLFVSGVAEHSPYKANARTLENEINATRFGPNVYWQIDPDTSFYTQYRHGLYSDGNSEDQIISRLERKFGDFFVAANFMNWSYAQDHQSSKGYFSPPDFLTYNGEVGWQGKVFDGLQCRVTTNLGQQRLNGNFDNAFSYQGNCTAKVTEKIEADFGYAYTNVRNRNANSSNFDSQSVSGQLRLNF